MNNELIPQKSLRATYWKWLLATGLIVLVFAFFIRSGAGKISTDLVKGYSDTELYENALKTVQSNNNVKQLLGDIEPIDKLAILEGEIHYSNDNHTVNSTVRIIGSKGKARMDIIADFMDNEWIYKTINVRIKHPPENKQTITIRRTE